MAQITRFFLLRKLCRGKEMLVKKDFFFHHVFKSPPFSVVKIIDCQCMEKKINPSIRRTCKYPSYTNCRPENYPVTPENSPPPPEICPLENRSRES